MHGTAEVMSALQIKWCWGRQVTDRTWAHLGPHHAAGPPSQSCAQSWGRCVWKCVHMWANTSGRGAGGRLASRLGCRASVAFQLFGGEKCEAEILWDVCILLSTVSEWQHHSFHQGLGSKSHSNWSQPLLKASLDSMWDCLSEAWGCQMACFWGWGALVSTGAFWVRWWVWAEIIVIAVTKTLIKTWPVEGLIYNFNLYFLPCYLKWAYC